MNDAIDSPAGRPWFARPMAAVVNRLRTSARLVVLILVLLCPGVGVAYSYIGLINGQVDFASSELAGTVVVEQALLCLADTAGGASPDLGRLRTAVREHPDLALDRAMAAAEAAAGRRAELATALAALITEAGNTSKLILDPDLDSFYVMDLHIVQLPKALTAAAVAAARGTGGSVADRAVNAGDLASVARTLRSDVETAEANTAMPGLQTRLAGVIKAADAADALATAITDGLDDPVAVDPGPLAATVRDAVPPAAAVLSDLLTTRRDSLSGDRLLTLAVTAVATLIAFWFAVAVWRRTRTDVALALDGVTALAAGDLAARAVPAGRDEMGDIGRALAAARGRLADQDRELADVRRVREEQLHATFLHQRDAERRLRERAQKLIDNSAGQIADEFGQITGQVEEVRAAAATIDERVSVANQATSSVVNRAKEAEPVIAALESSLRQVAGMAEVIAGIAGQTRLLALNATIEAARAGASGLGFAVVANEVKDLATNAAQSTEQITATIGSLERDAADMATAIAGMVAGIGDIDATTAVLHSVAAEQRAVVGRLDDRLAGTVEQIRGLSELATQLERRYSDRIGASAPLFLRVNGLPERHQAILVDLSSGGLRCRIEPPVRLDVGSTVEAELHLGGAPIRSHARVMHVEQSGDTQDTGMQFLAPDQESARRIERYVERQLEGALTKR